MTLSMTIKKSERKTDSMVVPHFFIVLLGNASSFLCQHDRNVNHGLMSNSDRNVDRRLQVKKGEKLTLRAYPRGERMY